MTILHVVLRFIPENIQSAYPECRGLPFRGVFSSCANAKRAALCDFPDTFPSAALQKVARGTDTVSDLVREKERDELSSLSLCVTAHFCPDWLASLGIAIGPTANLLGHCIVIPVRLDQAVSDGALERHVSRVVGLMSPVVRPATPEWSLSAEPVAKQPAVPPSPPTVSSAPARTSTMNISSSSRASATPSVATAPSSRFSTSTVKPASRVVVTVLSLKRKSTRSRTTTSGTLASAKSRRTRRATAASGGTTGSSNGTLGESESFREAVASSSPRRSSQRRTAGSRRAAVHGPDGDAGQRSSPTTASSSPSASPSVASVPTSPARLITFSPPTPPPAARPSPLRLDLTGVSHSTRKSSSSRPSHRKLTAPSPVPPCKGGSASSRTPLSPINRTLFVSPSGRRSSRRSHSVPGSSVAAAPAPSGLAGAPRNLAPSFAAADAASPTIRTMRT